jgi:hypothetical protein
MFGSTITVHLGDCGERADSSDRGAGLNAAEAGRGLPSGDAAVSSSTRVPGLVMSQRVMTSGKTEEEKRYLCLHLFCRNRSGEHQK